MKYIPLLKQYKKSIIVLFSFFLLSLYFGFGFEPTLQRIAQSGQDITAIEQSADYAGGADGPAAVYVENDDCISLFIEAFRALSILCVFVLASFFLILLIHSLKHNNA